MLCRIPTRSRCFSEVKLTHLLYFCPNINTRELQNIINSPHHISHFLTYSQLQNTNMTNISKQLFAEQRRMQYRCQISLSQTLFPKVAGGLRLREMVKLDKPHCIHSALLAMPRRVGKARGRARENLLRWGAEGLALLLRAPGNVASTPPLLARARP